MFTDGSQSPQRAGLGARGRRFKSCQPDKKTVPDLRKRGSGAVSNLSYRRESPSIPHLVAESKPHRTPLTCRNDIGVLWVERLVPNIFPKYSAAR
jgi:hypothetical protein